MMKRLTALLLAFFLLIGILGSCTSGEHSGPSSAEPVSDPATEPSESAGGSETEPVTAAPTPEDQLFAGADPLPDELDLPESVFGEDGTVFRTIVLPDGADTILSVAAEELQYHIQKITDTVFPIVGRTGSGYGSLIVATPESLSGIRDLFADDLGWLAELEEPETGKRWGSDGFAIRRSGSHIFLIGNTSRGALNAVYDFLEENFGILWIRSSEDIGLILDQSPTVTVTKTDYREKSPFELRGWHMLDLLNNPPETYRYLVRNKLNLISPASKYTSLESIGVENSTRIGINGILKSTMMESPIYDPDDPSLWCTDSEGNPLSPSESVQINIYSDKAAEIVAAAIVKQVDDNGYSIYFVGAEDTWAGVVIPDSTLPYEYAPGQFVQPTDDNYYSTVFHSFFNKVARKVAETYPDVLVGTYAYQITVRPPACDIEPNRMIVFAPIEETLSEPLAAPADPDHEGSGKNVESFEYLQEWAKKTSNLTVYNYYGCAKVGLVYERPILERIQDDLQHYAELGIWGLTPEGVIDGDGDFLIFYEGDGTDALHKNWTMNMLTYWVYSRLAWDPYQDLQELVEEFCRKVYGDAAPYMLEYHRLLKEGWDAGNAQRVRKVSYDLVTSMINTFFIKKPGIGDALIESLNQAYEAANDKQKQYIEYVRDTITNVVLEKANP